MELKISREKVPVSECIWDGIQEQGVEMDYILPDYYPDIFRLVRCELHPVVTDYSVNGDKLSYELQCEIRVLYCGEDGSSIQCITQKQNFTKTAELGKVPESPEISVCAKTDHVNYRAVNKRRLDIRGAVSVKIAVTGENEQEIISDASGMNIQLKKTPVTFASGRLSAEKIIQISEETEISAAQPSVTSVITGRYTPVSTEVKLISGKLLAKGEVKIKLLYCCENESRTEPLSFTIPYSQIIDIDSIDDTYNCTVTPEITGCEFTVSPDKNNENRIIRCDMEIRLKCHAVRGSSVMVVSDAYSTIYPCELSFSDIKAEQIPVIYSESFRHSVKICEGENVPKNIFAVWVTPKNINTRLSDDGNSVIITGMLTYTMSAKDRSDMLIMPDKDEAFEEIVSLGENVSYSSVNAYVSVTGVSYNIGSDGILTAKTDLSAEISAFSADSVKAVTDIIIDESVKKQRDGDYAIKLYFGVCGENVWNIAKKYSSNVDAVIEENELSGDIIDSDGMLLIPIKE